MKQIVGILKQHQLTTPDIRKVYTVFTQGNVGAFRLKPFPGKVEVTEGKVFNQYINTTDYPLDDSFAIPEA